MKNVLRYFLTIALLVSASSKADFFCCSTTKKLLSVVAIGAAAITFYTQKPASATELEKRRAIADEDTVTMCKRFCTETVIGQMGKAPKLVRCGENGKMQYEEYPATGIIGTTARMMKDQCLPVLGAIAAVESAGRKINAGWRKFGLNNVYDISMLLEVPSFAPENK